MSNYLLVCYYHNNEQKQQPDTLFWDSKTLNISLQAKLISLNKKLSLTVSIQAKPISLNKKLSFSILQSNSNQIRLF